MSCQVVVRSLSQWQEKHLGKEWENQLATFGQTLCMGCGDLAPAEYISKKCGKVTISVTNNQVPLMPLFSPVYTSTRPYSKTRSNTQGELRCTAIPGLRNEYRPGQELDCVVKGYDPEKEALRISVKETEPKPFEGAEFRPRRAAGDRR